MNAAVVVVVVAVVVVGDGSEGGAGDELKPWMSSSNYDLFIETRLA